MQPRQELLVAVTGSQEPYIYDLPHLLALPTDFEFRFRYRPQWVEKTLLAAIADSTDFRGHQLIVLFHSQDNQLLVPVRKATVVRIERLGPMVFLRFRVGALANGALPGSLLRRQTENCLTPSDLHQSAGRFLEDENDSKIRDYSKPLGDEMYLRRARSNDHQSLWADGNDPSVWASLVQILQREPSLEGVPIFRLLGFQYHGRLRRSVTVRNRFWNRKERIHGFRLVERRRYTLRTLEWAEPPPGQSLPQVRIQCLIDPNTLELEGASNFVVGRYDALEFSFTARRPGYFELLLRAEPSQREGQRASTPQSATSVTPEPTWRWMSWPAILALRVPVKVSYSKWRIFVSGLVGLGGIAAYLFSDSLADKLIGNIPSLATLPVKQTLQVVGLYALLIFWGNYVDKFLRARTEAVKVGGSNDDQPKPLLI